MTKTSKQPAKEEPKKETKGLGSKATKASLNADIGKSIKAATAKKLGSKITPKIKIEVKEVPKIIPHGGYTKEDVKEILENIPGVTVVEPHESKPATKSNTAKLPAKPTGSMARIDKVQSAIKQAIRAEGQHAEIPEAPGIPQVTGGVPIAESVTHLEPAMVRKMQMPTKKTGTAAPGKVSFEEIMQARQTQAAPVAPLFDASKYLKK